MFDKIYENIVVYKSISEQLDKLHESKSWEEIALALYGIIDDISTADDMCKENTAAFRNMVMKIQAKKNQYLYSPDGYTVKKVDEEEDKTKKFRQLVKQAREDFKQKHPDLSPIEIEKMVVSYGKQAAKALENESKLKEQKESIEALEDEYSDLELEIVRNVDGRYDIYVFGVIKWRNVPTVRDIKNLLKKHTESKLKEAYRVGDTVQLTHKKEIGYRIPGWAKGTIKQIFHGDSYFVNFEWQTADKNLTQLTKLDGEDIERVEESKLPECVCQIYDWDDDKLLEFYSTMDDGYAKAGALHQLPEDKAETEREIGKRGLEIPIKEGLESDVEILVRNELKNDPDIPKDELFQNVLDGVRDDIRDEVKQLLPQVYDTVIGRYFESKLNEDLTDHAQKELELAGLFDKDSDYDGMLGEAVLELIELFAKQGHSGMSAALTRELFDKLANFKTLTEITDDPDDWMDVTDYGDKNKPMWQSRRCPSLFSSDCGRTYWDIDEDYYSHTDKDGTRWSGGLSKEQWDNRPMHTSKHTREK